ncbi:MAG: universal stress protein [Fimbriimonadaceae bacterium]|nr:universal stress protein [Chitinophagales bacterium]
MAILFPTDFSEQSVKTFGYALEFAKKLNVPITLIHVYHIPVMNPATIELGTNMVNEELLNANETAMENKLKQFKDSLQAQYANSYPDMVKVSGMVRMGLVGDEIMRTAEEINAKYIVIGVKQRNDLNRFLIGSSTMHIINKSKIPVITVPENFNQLSSVQKIAYATDITFNDNTIIIKLLDLAKLFNATVKCFHVHDSKLEIENSIIDDFIEQYRAEANQNLITFQLIDNLNVLDGIDYFVKENNIDLLCVLKQKHYWLDIFEKKITKHLVFNENVPMLIYHE